MREHEAVPNPVGAIPRRPTVAHSHQPKRAASPAPVPRRQVSAERAKDKILVFLLPIEPRSGLGVIDKIVRHYKSRPTHNDYPRSGEGMDGSQGVVVPVCPLVASHCYILPVHPQPRHPQRYQHQPPRRHRHRVAANPFPDAFPALGHSCFNILSSFEFRVFVISPAPILFVVLRGPSWLIISSVFIPSSLSRPPIADTLPKTRNRFVSSRLRV